MDWLSDLYFGIGPAAPSRPHSVLPDQSATYNPSNCEVLTAKCSIQGEKSSKNFLSVSSVQFRFELTPPSLNLEPDFTFGSVPSPNFELNFAFGSRSSGSNFGSGLNFGITIQKSTGFPPE
ncbi:hypothetical protein GALMADRAFT_239448 [Galerina marginata CBS 339.88]|uniref:Uncharacterized protein n=1 Tax=Galerina marginata (strain CBS 339.88) TaxID=685588 RepID=A0A067TED4_GALM3|nr:hypothetical protein GALMADRAFT_239448 [Galerina marginata CBS 339.88]